MTQEIKFSNFKNIKYYLYSIIIILLSYFLALINLKFLLIIFFPLIILLINRIVLSRKLVFFLIFSSYFLLPQLDRYHILPVIDWRVALIFLMISFFYMLINFRYDSSYNFFFILFTIWLIFQLIRGILFHYPKFYLNNEIVKYISYPVGFYFILSITNKNDLKKILKNFIYLILILGIIISFQMLFYYVNITHGERVLTRQANLLLISFITALAILRMYKLTLIRKIILVFLSFFYLIGILIFMQRSLWIGLLVSITVFLFVSGKSTKFKIKSFIYIMLIISILLGGGFLFYSKFALNKKLFQERTVNIEEGVKESSIAVRLLSYIEIYHKIKKNPLIGKGMGDFIITTYLTQRRLGIVDNSFIVVIWKFGIIGFLIFSLIFIKNFKQTFFIMRNSEDKLFLLVTIIIFSSFIGHMVNGLACVVMTLYHFNFIWGTFIAIIEMIRKSISFSSKQVNCSI